MKIVFVSDAIYPYFKGGKEKRLYELSTRLAALGHEVHIYTMHWWSDPETVRLEDGVRLHALCPRYDLYHGDRRSIFEGIAFGLVCFKLMTTSFDIIDVDHMPFFPMLSTWLVCKLRGKKLYGTWHEALSTQEWIKYMGRGGYIAAAIEALSIRLPYAITASSSHTQHLLSARHHRTKHIAVVTPGIDITMIRDVAPAMTTCDILYVGRLVKDKRVDLLVRAMALVVQQQPNVTCIIVGKGAELPNIERLIHQLNLDNNVAILPPLPTAIEIYALMKRAKVFVLPSIREGFGIAALEALACGTPVVTTDSPANASKDLVVAGKTGTVVALKDNEIATAILNWIGTDTPRAAIADSVSSFDWQLLAHKQVSIYSKLS